MTVAAWPRTAGGGESLPYPGDAVLGEHAALLVHSEADVLAFVVLPPPERHQTPTNANANSAAATNAMRRHGRDRGRGRRCQCSGGPIEAIVTATYHWS